MDERTGAEPTSGNTDAYKGRIKPCDALPSTIRILARTMDTTEGVAVAEHVVRLAIAWFAAGTRAPDSLVRFDFVTAYEGDRGAIDEPRARYRTVSSFRFLRRDADLQWRLIQQDPNGVLRDWAYLCGKKLVSLLEPDPCTGTRDFGLGATLAVRDEYNGGVGEPGPRAELDVDFQRATRNAELNLPGVLIRLD